MKVRWYALIVKGPPQGTTKEGEPRFKGSTAKLRRFSLSGSSVGKRRKALG
jgi:hypothetical protein